MPLHKVDDGTDFQLHYEVIENVLPETTLFLHGNCASNRWWYPAEQLWKRAAKDKNYTGSMILAEFRGCGKSSTPKNENEVDMHVFAADFLSLLKSLNVGPVHLIGHSTGGLIATLMMAQAPKFFKKAILLDPVGAQGVRFDVSMIAAFEQMKVDKDLVAIVLGSTIHNNDVKSDFFRQIVVEDAFHAVKSVGHLVLKALDALDIREEVAKVPNEVLVLHGEFDTLLPKNDSKNLAELLPRGEFQIIEGQGHCTNVENPELFVKTASQFLF